MTQRIYTCVRANRKYSFYRLSLIPTRFNHRIPSLIPYFTQSTQSISDHSSHSDSDMASHICNMQYASGGIAFLPRGEIRDRTWGVARSRTPDPDTVHHLYTRRSRSTAMSCSNSQLQYCTNDGAYSERVAWILAVQCQGWALRLT